MKMSSYFKRGFGWLREALSRGGNLLPAWRLAVGEVPEVKFEDCLIAYARDPSCKAFVDFLADQSVGMGFYTTVNEEYAQAEEAKQAVDEFCEAVNLDGLLQIGTREVVGVGNSFWLKTNEESPFGLKVLPLTGFQERKAIERDETGVVKAYNYSFENVKKAFTPEQIIHFRWNPINFSPFGTGVLQVLLQEISFNGSKRISHLEMKWRIENVLPEVFEKWAGPDVMALFPGASPDKLQKYAALIKQRPKAGAWFIYDKPDADFKTVSIDPRARQFAEFIEYVLNQVYLGGQTPLPKLFTTPGFTEASAKAAIEIAERKVMALQRFIKRIVEREIFVSVLQAANYDPKQADCRLNWGIPEALDMETLIGILPVLEDSCLNAIIKPSELRAIYRDLLHLEQVEELERPEFVAEQPVKVEEGVEYVVRRRRRKSRGNR